MTKTVSKRGLRTLILEDFWLVVWNMTFIFPYIGNNHPNWLTFFRGIETTNQILDLGSILLHVSSEYNWLRRESSKSFHPVREFNEETWTTGNVWSEQPYWSLLHVCRTHSSWMHLNTRTQEIIRNDWVIHIIFYAYAVMMYVCIKYVCFYVLTCLQPLKFRLWSKESEQLSRLIGRPNPMKCRLLSANDIFKLVNILAEVWSFAYVHGF